MKKGKATHCTHNCEWYTPASIVYHVRRVLGSIDLDPASCELANETVKATKFYTQEDDGRLMPWNGTVFLNPPYNNHNMRAFAERAALHDAPTIVLANDAMETKWAQRLSAAANAICFPAVRLRFRSPNGDMPQPLQGQAIFGLRVDTALFEREFSQVGTVWTR